MSQRSYAIAFFVVLLATCAAAAAGAWFLWGRFGQQFRPRTVWTPAAQTTPTAAAAPSTPVAVRSPGATPAPSQRFTPALTPFFSPTPSATARPPTVTPGGAAPASPTASVSPPGTDTPLAAATPTATSPGPTAAHSFALARPVRDSAGDCPGAYILGVVTDQAGSGLASVSLWLVDEYGNQDTKTTKSAAGEVGRYDFPLFGPPRRFYLTVVDASGHPISPRVEVLHGLGASAQASCHWVDWQRR